MRIQAVVLEDIRAERMNQDAKWGADRSLPDGTWLLIAQEELGEASKDILEGNHSKAYWELIQATAVLVAWCERKLHRLATPPTNAAEEMRDEKPGCANCGALADEIGGTCQLCGHTQEVISVRP